MPKTVRRTLHYRHTDFLIKSPYSLEALIEAALAKAPLAENREVKVGEDVFQILNTSVRVKNTLCGTLHGWVHGQNQLVVVKEVGAKTYKIMEEPPPSIEAQEGAVAPLTDYLPHTLYFGVQGNHAIVLQGQGLMVGDLSSYLSWFVPHFLPDHVPSAQRLSFLPATSAMLRKKGVDKAKAICIKRPLADVVERAPKGNETKPVEELVVPKARASAVTKFLRCLGVKAPDSILNNKEAKDLQITLEIRRPYNRDPMGNEAMNAIGKAVAAENGEEFSVELLDGSVLKGSELKLFSEFDLPLIDGATFPSEGVVFQKIDEYLHRLISEGMV